jgi:hypothetical protein
MKPLVSGNLGIEMAQMESGVAIAWRSGEGAREVPVHEKSWSHLKQQPHTEERRGARESKRKLP